MRSRGAGGWCSCNSSHCCAGFDLAALDPLGTDCIHTVVECAKLAYADREAWYGDPRFADVPLGTLLSDKYNEQRRRLIGPHASLELRPGDLPGAHRLGGPATPQAGRSFWQASRAPVSRPWRGSG